MMKYCISVLLLLVGCSTRSIDSGVVVSPEPRAGQVGAAILRQGGNAVDAAIAVHFALAVTFPNAGNIGGGGFMLIHDARGHDYALDYRETAPAKAGRDMFLNAQGNVDSGLSLESALASGVPGSVRGMWEAHRRFGRLPWARLIEPSIKLAEEGFEIDAWTASSFEEARQEIAKRSPAMRAKANFSTYFHGRAGEKLQQPELSKTFHLIAERGPAGFYEGPTAESMVAEMNRTGGLITLEDFTNYRAKWRTPIEGSYLGHRIVSMGPPSSGGIGLIQMLHMFDSFARPNYHTAGHLHLVAEIEKRVFADRTAYEGDADFVNVPSAALIDKSYCRRRAAAIDPGRKSDPSRIESGLGPTPLPLKARHESPQTTHFSIVDREGMAVANTTTLNDGYGSGIVVPGAGFLLNNEMDDFSAKPGARNLYGVTGGTANQIEPGKRMLSSMCPTFVYRPDGKLWLVLGTPGGSTIFTTVFQVIVNRIDYGMNLDEAVRTQRFHHQWPPPIGSDPIQIEKAGGGGLRTGTVDELARLGYSIKWRGAIGQVQAIEIDANHAVGAADPRGIGVVERD